MTVEWTLLTAILALCAGNAGYLLGARRGARPTASIPPDVECPPVAPSPHARTVEQAVTSVAGDAALVRARELARTQHAIAEHLGFESMPDPSQPSLRSLGVDACDRAALAHLQSGAVPCVRAVTLSRDRPRATLLIDVSIAAPAREHS